MLRDSLFIQRNEIRIPSQSWKKRRIRPLRRWMLDLGCIPIERLVSGSESAEAEYSVVKPLLDTFVKGIRDDPKT
jgi:hypothetical protein